jgi:hypothetical protein
MVFPKTGIHPGSSPGQAFWDHSLAHFIANLIGNSWRAANINLFDASRFRFASSEGVQRDIDALVGHDHARALV